MGTIIKTAKVFTETAGKILMNSTGGDITLNSAKKVIYSAKKTIEIGKYEKIDPNKKIVSAIWVDAKTKEIIQKVVIGQEINILVETLNYEQGENISLKIEDVMLVNDNEEIVEKQYSGVIDAKGQALLQEHIIIE